MKNKVIIAFVAAVALLGFFMLSSKETTHNQVTEQAIQAQTAEVIAKADQPQSGESTVNGNKAIIRVNVRKSATKN